MDYKELIERLRRRESDMLINHPMTAQACRDAATAITDLLSRAEEAKERAEKAEKEKDEALKLIGWIYYEACLSVEYNMRQYLDWLKDKIEEWQKMKEE